MNILIVEDDEAIRTGLGLVLELNGHSVLAAADGFAAIKLAERGPHFIFCDIGLPGMDGYQVFDEIQKLPQCHGIPFVFLTAMTDRESQRHGMTLGADDFITKPFAEREILAVIEARIRRQKPQRERIEALVADRCRAAGAEWSHELMTPLTSVLGGLELIELEIDSLKPDELKDLLAIIRGGAERQYQLSKKIMVYFELERLKMSRAASKARCDASVAIAAGVSAVAERCTRGSDLTVSVAEGTVALDGAHLSAAIAELVANAFIFSKPGELVTVSGVAHPGRYRIEVADLGPGMSPEQCARVGAFQQFGRAQQNQQGLGLGLAIARAAAEIAGGQFLVQAGADGRGLQVALDLPRFGRGITGPEVSGLESWGKGGV
jgi:two-component system sensor histidine kinase/response regulator